MKYEASWLFCLLYICIYLAAILIGIGFSLWFHEVIFILGFGFFGCFIAARLAINNVSSALSISSAWLIGFISTSLINCLLLVGGALAVYFTHQYISVELADNANWLLLASQGFSALFILGGLKYCHIRLVTS